MSDLPGVCLVGPLLGKNPGWGVSQGELLGEVLSGSGYNLTLVSSRPGRVARALDTVWVLGSRRKRFDVVILMVFSGPAFTMSRLSSFAVKRLRRKLVLWLHGGNLPAFAEQNRGRVEVVFRRADATVAPSRFLEEFARSLGSEVRVIPNLMPGGGPAFVRRQEICPRLLWMRTFHELYNPFMALSVLAALRQKFPTALLTMAGQDKGLLTKVQERAALLGLSDAVRFPGFLNEERKKTELVRHDVFINTSRADNSPASLLEAAAAGLVVVSTDVGGIDQMFPRDQAALLVPDDDHEGMAAAIGRVVDDSLLARRLVERGRIVADESNPSRVLGRWEELLREVMDA